MLLAIKNFFTRSKTENLSTLLIDNSFLVDVRSPEEFKAGSVSGAVNIPLDKIQNQLQAFKNKSNIIVFCRSGNRSSQAKSMLMAKGFTNVINGGTWQNVKKLTSN